jgi:hypothetical protein
MDRASQSREGRARKTRRSWRRAWLLTVGLAGALCAGCGDKTPPAPPPCERECQDGVALRALREMMKFAFNHTFQSEPVGQHDLTTDKFLRGSARVYGTAFANGEQGVTEVDLTYVFTQALYAKKEDEPEENYVMALDGAITQKGKIAVQPTSPTALKIESESVAIAGMLYDPPIEYAEIACKLEILQNGNSVAGMFCGRVAGFAF